MLPGGIGHSSQKKRFSSLSTRIGDHMSYSRGRRSRVTSSVILHVIFILYHTANAYTPVSVATSSKLPNTPAKDLHQFLGSPANWPRIVASSSSVRSPDGKNLDQPLTVGSSVDEIFGLPPVLPLCVTWKCVKSVKPTKKRAGTLEFYSQNGLPGIASDCRMIFDISNSEQSDGGSDVVLRMIYEPESPLAVLAVPVLTADNTLALKLLLPSVLTSDVPSPLNEFRRLMGALYGVAGLAHLADCVVGPSQLLVSAGSPPFYELVLLGQAYALLWCATGPVSFVTSRIGGRAADLGLVVYGLVEVLGAYLVRFADTGAAELDPFSNAVVVQVIIVLAWLYSSQKKADALSSENDS